MKFHIRLPCTKMTKKHGYLGNPLSEEVIVIAGNIPPYKYHRLNHHLRNRAPSQNQPEPKYPAFHSPSEKYLPSRI